MTKTKIKRIVRELDETFGDGVGKALEPYIDRDPEPKTRTAYKCAICGSPKRGCGCGWKPEGA